MKKSFLQTTVCSIRNITPVPVRQKIGPILAYITYVDRLYFRKNKPKPIILSIEETVNFLLDGNASMIRFGDGEISLIEGTDLPFQKWDTTLAKKLEEIIKVNDPKLLICIPGMWGKLDIFEPYAYKFIMHHMYRYSYIWNNLLSYKKVYGDTNVTRHYLAYKNKENAEKIFNKLKQVWKNKNVILVEGEKSRLGVGNNLFKETSSLKRVLCPPENAFSKYSEIKSEVSKNNKDNLILISLGPTAKLLAYDLFKEGYRVLDIGHRDMEDEMFLRKELKQVKVPHKYFNEINERNPEECLDDTYIKEIVAVVR